MPVSLLCKTVNYEKAFMVNCYVLNLLIVDFADKFELSYDHSHKQKIK